MNLLQKLEKIDDVLTSLENNLIDLNTQDPLLKTCYILYSNSKNLEIVNDFLNYEFFNK